MLLLVVKLKPIGVGLNDLIVTGQRLLLGPHGVRFGAVGADFSLDYFGAVNRRRVVALVIGRLEIQITLGHRGRGRIPGQMTVLIIERRIFLGIVVLSWFASSTTPAVHHHDRHGIIVVEIRRRRWF